MTKRITITITDSLADRLDEVKSEMNVSRICAQAIDEAIRKHHADKAVKVKEDRVFLLFLIWQAGRMA